MERALAWFIFGILVSLVAPLLNGVLATLASNPTDLSLLRNFGVLFGNGELLMITVGLAASVIGDMVTTAEVGPLGKSSVVGVAVVLGLVAIGSYGIIIGLERAGSTLPGSAVATVSYTPYIAMLIVNAVSLVITKR